MNQACERAVDRHKHTHILLPILVAARSRAWDCWDCGFESRWEHGCLSFLSLRDVR
jgi:hypothetical protein